MRKYKGFYCLITPRPDPYADFLLHVCTSPDAAHMHCSSYPSEPEAIVAAEAWIETMHKTVRDYYRL